MGSGLDLDGDDVIDARALMDSIDWSAVPPPPPASGVAVTDDGRRLATEEEFDEWLRAIRRPRAGA